MSAELHAQLVAQVVPLLRSRLPGLLSVYAFGSRITGQARPDSDLDLAVLVAGYADVTGLWHLASEVADQVGCDVDLLDMRAASTVLQYQILTQGQRLWVANPLVGAWEAAVLSDKLDLDVARAGYVQDILREGSVHGR